MSPASALDALRIGSIGLGKMGLPICERLATQGFAVTALTRNPEGRERAARANLQSEPKIGGVVASADILVSAISDAAVLLGIVFKVGGRRRRCTPRRYRGNQHTLSGCLPASRRTDIHDWGVHSTACRRRSYAPAFAVNQIMKDLDIIGEVSRQDHCSMPLATQVKWRS
jgi:3-hydroxyisobutyrate dehydrogenase-like beta-hydroxyacid dehydrogenase